MTDPARRKQLVAEAAVHPPAAGVYRIVNVRTGKGVLGSAVNLPSAANRLAFAQSTGSPAALDARLVPDAYGHGLEHLTFEVLDELPVTAEMGSAEVRADLATLEQLWRDRLDPSTLY